MPRPDLKELEEHLQSAELSVAADLSAEWSSAVDCIEGVIQRTRALAAYIRELEAHAEAMAKALQSSDGDEFEVYAAYRKFTGEKGGKDAK